MLSLNTRGELRVNSYRSKVREESLASDPLVERARTALRRSGCPGEPDRRPTAAGSGRAANLVLRGPVRPGSAPPAAAPTPEAPTVTQLQAPGPTPLPPPSKPSVPPPPAPPWRPWIASTASPRAAAGSFNVKTEAVADGRQAVIVTGGVILNVRNVQAIGLLDLEADRLVIWTSAATASSPIADAPAQPEGADRQRTGVLPRRQRRDAPATEATETRAVLRADEVYYDVNRNVAVALNAQLEIREPKARPADRTSAPTRCTSWPPTSTRSSRHHLLQQAAVRPRPEGATSRDATLEEQTVPQLNIFGSQVVDRKTGPADLTGRDAASRRATSSSSSRTCRSSICPSSPATPPTRSGRSRASTSASTGSSAFQLGVTLDVYELLGIQQSRAPSWQPQRRLPELPRPGLGQRVRLRRQGSVRPHRTKYDGSSRATASTTATSTSSAARDAQPGLRPARLPRPLLLAAAGYDLPDGFTVQAPGLRPERPQLPRAVLTRRSSTATQPGTFVYVKQQEDNWAWTGLVEPRIRTGSPRPSGCRASTAG